MQMLTTMTSDNNHKTEQLSTELTTANKQVQELQDRIARMEMFFLQHATGLAPEPMNESTLRSISGARSTGDLDSESFLEAARRRRANSDFDTDLILSPVEKDSIEVDRALEVC